MSFFKIDIGGSKEAWLLLAGAGVTVVALYGIIKAIKMYRAHEQENREVRSNRPQEGRIWGNVGINQVETDKPLHIIIDNPQQQQPQPEQIMAPEYSCV